MVFEILKPDITFNSKDVYLLSPLEAFKLGIISNFATLFLANCVEDIKNVSKCVIHLIEIGCVEFCCTGQYGLLLHDTLDEIIEESGNLDVVTIFIEDESEACEYFLHASGGGNLDLLAILTAKQKIKSSLFSELKSNLEIK